jgi:hypothetical protein
MGEKVPVLEKREIRLPDGRRLVFYEFPEPARREAPAPPKPAGRRAGEDT